MFITPLVKFEGNTEKFVIDEGTDIAVLMLKPASISLIWSWSYVYIKNYPVGAKLRGLLTPTITMFIGLLLRIVSCVFNQIMLSFTEMHERVDAVQAPSLRVSVGRRISSGGTITLIKPFLGTTLSGIKVSVYLELMPEVTGSVTIIGLPKIWPEVGVKLPSF